MRARQAKTSCDLCGATLEVADPRRIRAGVVSASNKPTFRVLMLDGVEIHRCPVTGSPRRQRTSR
jgi:hypothetical protein